jgi:hypothetical protein
MGYNEVERRPGANATRTTRPVLGEVHHQPLPETRDTEQPARAQAGVRVTTYPLGLGQTRK